MYNDQKSTEFQAQARQRRMARGIDAQPIDEISRTIQAPAKVTRTVFASVNGYAQAEVVTTRNKRV